MDILSLISKRPLWPKSRLPIPIAVLPGLTFIQSEDRLSGRRGSAPGSESASASGLPEVHARFLVQDPQFERFQAGRCGIPVANVERQQMLLPGMAMARERRVFPIDEPLRPLRLPHVRVATGIEQPGFKPFIHRPGAVRLRREECPHVVEREAGADDEQRSIVRALQGPPHPDVFGRIEAFQQGQLDTGNVRARIHDFQRDEQAVIESSFAVQFGMNARRGQLPGDPCRQRGRARAGVFDLVGCLRKAVIVVYQRRIRARSQGGAACFPMRADDDDCRRLCHRRRDLFQAADHLFVGRVSQKRQGSCAV